MCYTCSHLGSYIVAPSLPFVYGLKRNVRFLATYPCIPIVIPSSDIKGNNTAVTQFIHSIFVLVLGFCEKYSTSLHSIFNIIEKARNMQHLSQRRAAKIQYVLTKFERDCKR